jgi:hypothetical protein
MPAGDDDNLRAVAADGTPIVTVVVAKSLPFARGLIEAWKAIDQKDRSWMLRNKAFIIPAAIYDEIAPRVRERLRTQADWKSRPAAPAVPKLTAERFE